jgi:predicted  nucleic acid-binding Zn-ribbon protein
MNPWEERVQTSQAKTSAEQLKTLISSLDLGTYEPSIREQLQRVEVVADTVLDKLNNSDPRLVNTSALASVGSNLTNAATYLSTWINSGTDPDLTTYVQSELDAAVNQLAMLTPNQDVPEAREAITRLRRSIAGNITAADKLIAQLKERGSEADASISEKVEEAKNEFTTLQKDITDLDTELKAIRSSSASVSTEQTTAFTKAEADRSTKFTELLDTNQKRLTSTFEELEKKTADSVTVIRKKIYEDQKSIEGSKAEVEKLLGIVGEEALVGDYSKRAKTELKFAEGWAIATFLSIFLAIIVGAFFANDVSKLSQNGRVTWQYMIAKVILIVTFGALAAYAARQSTEHRNAQRDSEQMALQLSALPPYSNNVTDVDLRNKLLIDLAAKLFGKTQPVIKGARSKKDDNPLLATQLAEALLELLKQMKN